MSRVGRRETSIYLKVNAPDIEQELHHYIAEFDPPNSHLIGKDPDAGKD